MKQTTTAYVATVIGLLSFAGLAAGQSLTTAPASAQQPPQPVAQAPATNPGAPGTTAAPVPTGPAAKIVFDKMEHDFGRISDEGDAEAVFHFVNKGEGKLIFSSQPRASCGCTAGKLEKLEFEPGEGGDLSVKFNARGKHGDQNQKVMANTNDPANPEVTCKIHSFVKPTFSIDPPLAGFGEVLAGQTAKQTVKVKGPKDFAVTYASNTRGRYLTSKVLSTQPAEVDGEPGSESVVEFTLLGNAPRGTFQSMTTCRTNLEKHPLVEVQVSAEIVGDLQVLPPRLNVGVVEGNQQFSKSFRVSSRTGKNFKIKSATQKSGTLASPVMTTITPAEPGKETAYTVEVAGMSPGAGSPLMATVSVITEQDGVEETMEVSLNGVVRMPTPANAATPGVFNPPGGGLPPPPPTPTDKPKLDSDTAPAPK